MGPRVGGRTIVGDGSKVICEFGLSTGRPEITDDGGDVGGRTGVAAGDGVDIGNGEEAAGLMVIAVDGVEVGDRAIGGGVGCRTGTSTGPRVAAGLIVIAVDGGEVGD
jgi:hypothetical protein